ncbi:glutamate ABC transporter substrate-binding protein [Streptomyces aidingensis]|uniref:Polar amino acid transport system substrate-binding protein n=1 Tax=Streptomyces aidingensis TaxID=910347 RepID=A0A1I1FAS6_9ACTN|nr:glutamate ABC transporter substrate-binding protein [Streptomyces aidingensis]SFB96579.1 polar amino acid transport system substrate-binding protein [Streptomyces aidingensis]
MATHRTRPEIHPAEPSAGRPRRTPRAGNGRALLLAAAGLALAAVMLVCTVLDGGTGGRPEPFPELPGVEEAEQAASEQTRPAAEREVCEDGTDPADSLAPSPLGPDEGEAVRRIQERGALIVGVDQNSYLWGFRDPENHIVGFDIDLVRAIAEDLLGPDPDIVFKAVPTSERIPLLRERKIDMVVRTMSITCRRWEKVAFSTAYFEAGQQLLVERDSGITGLDESLDGQRVCRADGSTAADLLERADAEGLGATVVRAPNHLDCLVLVQLGEADALMTDSALAAGHAAQDPAMHLVGEPLTIEPYGVAMHLEDTDLVRRVNRVLEEWTSGGTDSGWRQSYNRWLAGHLGDDSPAPPAPRYGRG